MISLILPVYNEEHLLKDLISRSLSTLDSIGEEFEIVCVDDGSDDNSLGDLLEYRKKDPRLKVLSLSRNFGIQAALTAGIEHASGDHIVLMDADLQDPPELIADMYAKMKTGKYDIINARRISRKEKGRRKFLIKGFHFIFKRVSGLKNVQHVGNYSLFNRPALNALLQLKEKIRYLPGLRSYIGFRQGEVEYEREDRPSGRSKTTTRWLFSMGADAIYSFSKIPLKICLYLGIIGIFVFFVAGIYVLLAKIFGFAVIGWSSTLLSIYFLGSIQLTFLGVIGEYLFRIYKESQDRPIYLVRKFYSDGPENE